MQNESGCDHVSIAIRPVARPAGALAGHCKMERVRCREIEGELRKVVKIYFQRGKFSKKVICA